MEEICVQLLRDECVLGADLAVRTSEARAQGCIRSVPGRTFTYSFISSIHLCAPSWDTDDGVGWRELCVASDACQSCGSTGAATGFLEEAEIRS